jgi:hypothetical protein
LDSLFDGDDRKFYDTLDGNNDLDTSLFDLETRRKDYPNLFKQNRL